MKASCLLNNSSRPRGPPQRAQSFSAVDVYNVIDDLTSRKGNLKLETSHDTSIPQIFKRDHNLGKYTRKSKRNISEVPHWLMNTRVSPERPEQYKSSLNRDLTSNYKLPNIESTYHRTAGVHQKADRHKNSYVEGPSMSSDSKTDLLKKESKPAEVFLLGGYAKNKGKVQKYKKNYTFTEAQHTLAYLNERKKNLVVL